MIFKEAFEHYKAGIATPEEAVYVEQELEKNQLISEYLTDDFDVDLESEETAAEGLKSVKKSIRKRSRNIVTISVGIIVVLALLVHYAAVPLINNFFYNPMKRNIDENTYDIDFSLIAYTELHQAGIYYANTEIENTGIGKYNMTLVRYNLSTNEPDYTAASLNKNNLIIPFSFETDNLSMNIFARVSSPVYDLDPETKENLIKELKELPNYMSVMAAVSFSEDLTMDQLISMIDSSDVDFLWAGIRNAPEDIQRYPLCGMDLTGAGPVYEKINKNYPAFELSASSSSDAPSASDYETHFISLLQYSIDHPYFLKELNADSNYSTYYPSVLDYVKYNGVKTYGVMVKGSAADILSLMDGGNVSQIWPLDADVNF